MTLMKEKAAATQSWAGNF